jgi:hypothetical protein
VKTIEIEVLVEGDSESGIDSGFEFGFEFAFEFAFEFYVFFYILLESETSCIWEFLLLTSQQHSAC